jgi:hypothetical protein
MAEHGNVDHDKLDAHGDGEFEPHRPPKYVEGVYKPHFADPDADYVLMSASMLPNDFDGGLYWAQTDEDGDAAGVVRRLDGTPITEGADMVVGYIYDGVIELREGNYVDYNERIDIAVIPEKPDA